MQYLHDFSSPKNYDIILLQKPHEVNGQKLEFNQQTMLTDSSALHPQRQKYIQQKFEQVVEDLKNKYYGYYCVHLA